MDPGPLQPAQPRGRLPVLDLWRGVVMVIMALDHANNFIGFHPAPEGMAMPFVGRMRPDFPSNIAFFSRFITHYCAPSFFFLAGASTVLLAASRRERGLSQTAISGHFLLRGVLLIVLEYTVMMRGWGLGWTGFLVLACLGACLALGAILRFLPFWPAVLLGLGLLFAHPYLADPATFRPVASLPAHVRRVLFLAELGARLPTLYPIVPWLSLYLLGIGFGRALAKDAERALRWTLVVGVACIGAWLALRLTDGFGRGIGNLTPFREERGWRDFFMMSKYPPAADFALWTLGGAFLFCWAVRKPHVAGAAIFAPIRVFGRTALFFYVAHIFVYRWLAEWLLGQHGTTALFAEKSVYPAAYTAWIIGLVILLPLCLLWAALKRRFPGFPLDLL